MEVHIAAEPVEARKASKPRSTRMSTDENTEGDVYTVYYRNKLPILNTLRTYLSPSVYEDPNKFPAKITIKQRMGILKEIKETLVDWELEMFRESCFGRFLEIDMDWTEGGFSNAKRNTFAGQYVHFLMLRRINCAKQNELWFLIDGKPIRFSLQEFAIVTGLRCSEKVHLSEEKAATWGNRLRDIYFDGDTSIKVNDIARVFRTMQDIADKRREDRVKVALFYFLEGVLFSSDSKGNTSSMYMSMVDDMDMFNSYPWGVHVFSATISSLSSKNLVAKYSERLQKPIDRQDHRCKETYTLCGFPFAFQIWAFEAIPFLGCISARRLEGTRSPRFLNWGCKEGIPSLEKITTASKDQQVVVYPILQLTEEEIDVFYMQSITRLSDANDDVIEELTTTLESVPALKNEDALQPAQAYCPPQPDIIEGALAEMEMRLMSHIDRVEERLQIRFDAEIMRLSQKVETLFAMQQSRETTGVADGDRIVVEDVGETMNEVNGGDDDDRMAYVMPDAEPNLDIFSGENLKDNVRELKKWGKELSLKLSRNAH